MNGGFPYVRTKFPAPNGPIRSGLDPLGEVGSCPRSPLEDGVQLGVGPQAELSLEFHDVGDAIPKVHTIKTNHRKWIVNPLNLASPKLGIHADNAGMARKRPETPLNVERFIAEVRAYKDRTKKTHQVISDEIGIELGYLQKILYRDKPLTYQVVEKAAPLFGRLVRDFIIEDTKANDKAAESEQPRDEDFGNIMAIIGPNLTPAFKEHLKALAVAAQVGPTPQEVRAERDKARKMDLVAETPATYQATKPRKRK